MAGIASGRDHTGRTKTDECSTGLTLLVCADVIRPSLEWHGNMVRLCPAPATGTGTARAGGRGNRQPSHRSGGSPRADPLTRRPPRARGVYPGQPAWRRRRSSITAARRVQQGPGAGVALPGWDAQPARSVYRRAQLVVSTRASQKLPAGTGQEPTTAPPDPAARRGRRVNEMTARPPPAVPGGRVPDLPIVMTCVAGRLGEETAMTDTEGEPERRIVVGVDGSVPSKSVLAWAVRQARLTGAAARRRHVRAAGVPESRPLRGGRGAARQPHARATLDVRRPGPPEPARGASPALESGPRLLPSRVLNRPSAQRARPPRARLRGVHPPPAALRRLGRDGS